jgi:hypothetical protein
MLTKCPVLNRSEKQPNQQNETCIFQNIIIFAAATHLHELIIFKNKTMYINNLIANIHWIPVLVMTIFSFALGSFWHSPVLFGKVWKKENNFPDSKSELNLALIFGGTAVLNFIALAGLSAVVGGLTLTDGLLTGFSISIVWTLTTIGGTYLFANRSLKILAIDAGMYILLFSIAGTVLAIW